MKKLLLLLTTLGVITLFPTKLLGQQPLSFEVQCTKKSNSLFIPKVRGIDNIQYLSRLAFSTYEKCQRNGKEGYLITFSSLAKMKQAQEKLKLIEVNYVSN